MDWGRKVMVLLGIVLGFVVFGSIAATNFMGTSEGHRDSTIAQVGMLESAIDMYRFQVNEYPESLTDLIKQPKDPRLASGWRGPYLNKKSVPTDEWGEEFKYQAPGKHNIGKYDVWSVGLDGRDGTADDIGNWDRETGPQT